METPHDTEPPAELSRRGFIGGTLSSTAAAATAVTLGRLGVHAAAARPSRSSGAPPHTSSVAPGPFVLCTLYGGNDGLNTVPPYQAEAYQSLRGDIAVSPTDALPLGVEGANGYMLGLHPSLTTLWDLWTAGQLAVILGVEYPSPNYSHFESMDIWQTANLSGEFGSGWLGRWLDATGSDPLRALSIGSQVPIAFAGAQQQAGTLADSTNPQSQEPDGDPVFASAYRELMRANPERGLEAAIAANGTNLLTVGKKASTALTVETPPNDTGGRDSGDIGNQLEIVAEMIEYGVPTKAYGVSYGSFDTHSAQAEAHAGLLSQLDAGLESFFSAFPTAQAGKSPVVMVYSEFGRRPEANASGGTDHSSSSVVFVAGPSVKGGFYGAQPSLTKLDDLGNFVVTTDFRRIYATILEQVLGIDGSAVLGKKFGTIGFL